jgi:hypothetical protein
VISYARGETPGTVSPDIVDPSDWIIFAFRLESSPIVLSPDAAADRRRVIQWIEAHPDQLELFEHAQAKGRRYLAEGRLLVDRVDGDEIRARCRGGGALYELGYSDGSWFCSCPALTTCSHLAALQLVTAPEPPL